MKINYKKKLGDLYYWGGEEIKDIYWILKKFKSKEIFKNLGVYGLNFYWWILRNRLYVICCKLYIKENERFFIFIVIKYFVVKK